jgi:flavin-dependent dehydrogenase
LKNVAIIGGGLAGLTSAIQLATAGVEVTVFEKKKYPFHRVCGEYISNETVPFLKANGIYPEEFNPTKIEKLQLTSVNGKSTELPLELGGFGISRYVFDQYLFEKATKLGVKFFLQAEVDSVQYQDDSFTIIAEEKKINADVVIGSFGKRSKLDLTLKRNFIQRRSPYVGVKYHVKDQHPANLISLHNFRKGYCGVSKIEDDKTNICYLTHRDNVKAYKNIKEMEEAVLFENPFLKKIFENAEFLFDRPEVINEISFETKFPVEQHILMSGDAAGMITPLCGNGMALAIHSSKLMSELVFDFCQNRISRTELEKQYTAKWNQHFASRLWVGRLIQNLFGKPWASNFAVSIAQQIRPVANYLISKTHGNPF